MEVITDIVGCIMSFAILVALVLLPVVLFCVIRMFNAERKRADAERRLLEYELLAKEMGCGKEEGDGHE